MTTITERLNSSVRSMQSDCQLDSMVKWWSHISFTVLYEHTTFVLKLKATNTVQNHQFVEIIGRKWGRMASPFTMHIANKKIWPCLFWLRLYLRYKVVGPRIIHTNKSTEKLLFIVLQHWQTFDVHCFDCTFVSGVNRWTHESSMMTNRKKTPLYCVEISKTSDNLIFFTIVSWPLLSYSCKRRRKLLKNRILTILMLPFRILKN